MDKGKILAFIENKKIILGVCLDVKKDRLHCLTETNRETNLPSQRILLKSDNNLNLSESRTVILERIKEEVQKQEVLKNEISPHEIWEIVKDEGEVFSIRYLSQLIFGNKSTFEHEGAVLRALFEDKVYFKLQKDKFSVQSPFQVEQNLLKIQREQEKEEMMQEGSLWLKEIWEGKETFHPKRKNEYIEILKEMAICGEESPHYIQARELLTRANLNHPHAAFELMVKMGIWDEDENLLLYRYQIPVEWSDSLMAEVKKICSQHNLQVWKNKRTDLTSLHCFSIDYENTKDVDDALSVEILKDNHLRVGIHITDVAEILPPDSLLNEEAYERGESIYFPEGKIPMIPLMLSEDLCSLLIKKERPALSIFVDLNRQGEVLGLDFLPSIIEIKERFTYTEVDNSINKDERFKLLFELSLNLRKMRVQQGALILSLPEVFIHVNKNKEIILEKRDKESPSQIMVSEFMILANWLSARFLKERGAPAIFRFQQEPREIIDMASEQLPELLLNYRQKRLLSRAEIGINPLPHSTLGLDCYTTITSPIRRYSDLVVQRQIKSLLNGSRPEYTNQELQIIIETLEITQNRIRIVEQQRTRYWLLKYLSRMEGKTISAMVLEKHPRGYLLLLTDYLLEVNTTILNRELKPGDEVKVKIEKVDPKMEIIRVTPL